MTLQSMTESSIQSPNTSSSFSVSLIRNHIETCNRLLQENKINQKNAWNLNIVDSIRSILKADKDVVLSNVASSLDVGAKVYGVRVDDIHTKVLSLADTLATEQAKENNEEDSENSENTIEKKTRTRQARKIIANSAILAKNVEDNTVPNVNNQEMGPQTLKENSELSASENLFNILYSKMVDECSCQFKKVYIHKHNPEIILDVINDFDMPDLGNAPLCEAFYDFEIGEEEDANATLLNNEPVIDEEGNPLVEFDTTINGINFDDDCEPLNDNEDEEFINNMKFQGEALNVVSTIPTDSLISTDYGFRPVAINPEGQQMYRFWAGPSFWKHKLNKRPARPFFSGKKIAEAPKSTRKTKVVEINYDLTETFDHTIPVEIKRKPGQTEKITLPPYSNTFNEQINHSMVKPSSFITAVKQSTRSERNCDVEPYNYDNLNDSTYCPETQPDDFVDEHEIVKQKNYVEENLVAAPDLVTVSQVPYALRAKNINIKQLKSNMWSELKKDDNMDFKRLYQSVKSSLPVELGREMSAHLGIVALLHLCNEHNLILKQRDNSNCFIQKEA